MVIKLGGSVLVTEQDYTNHVRRIRDMSLDTERIYLVVSAQKGITDKLVNSLNINWSDRDKAKYLLSGELASARKIYQRLLDERVNVRLLMQGSGLFPVVANSSYIDAELHLDESMDRREVLDYLDSKVVVIPGFGGENENAEPVILGRNSSDLVAGLVARIDPNVDEVVFVKDVPGVYDEDKKVISSLSLPEAKGFEMGKLLEGRVLQYACCDLRIKGIDSEGTVVRY
ncbi:MAG: hypothetical protein KJ771_00670 [Nanoarchaeota archaeon]|nr:hypothetical protein [Nanoarchaeota archaeon]